MRFFDFWSNASLKNWFADNLTPQSTTRATAAIASNTWGGGEPIVRSKIGFRVYIVSTGIVLNDLKKRGWITVKFRHEVFIYLVICLK